MDKLNTTSLAQRLKGKTPPFWVKVRQLGLACAAIGGALVALPSEYISWLPANIPGILITAGAVIGALASLTVQDPVPPASQN